MRSEVGYIVFYSLVFYRCLQQKNFWLCDLLYHFLRWATFFLNTTTWTRPVFSCFNVFKAEVRNKVNTKNKIFSLTKTTLIHASVFEHIITIVYLVQPLLKFISFKQPNAFMPLFVLTQVWFSSSRQPIMKEEREIKHIFMKSAFATVARVILLI